MIIQAENEEIHCAAWILWNPIGERGKNQSWKYGAKNYLEEKRIQTLQYFQADGADEVCREIWNAKFQVMIQSSYDQSMSLAGYGSL